MKSFTVQLHIQMMENLVIFIQPKVSLKFYQVTKVSLSNFLLKIQLYLTPRWENYLELRRYLVIYLSNLTAFYKNSRCERNKTKSVQTFQVKKVMKYVLMLFLVQNLNNNSINITCFISASKCSNHICIFISSVYNHNH